MNLLTLEPNIKSHCILLNNHIILAVFSERINMKEMYALCYVRICHTLIGFCENVRCELLYKQGLQMIPSKIKLVGLWYGHQ
jgi:hypothetical protein